MNDASCSSTIYNNNSNSSAAALAYAVAVAGIPSNLNYSQRDSSFNSLNNQQQQTSQQHSSHFYTNSKTCHFEQQNGKDV